MEGTHDGYLNFKESIFQKKCVGNSEVVLAVEDRTSKSEVRVKIGYCCVYDSSRIS